MAPELCGVVAASVRTMPTTLSNASGVATG
jgi:hypothetical protein